MSVRRSTGVFQEIPQIRPVSEIFNGARRRALKSEPEGTSKNAKEKAQKQGTVRINALSAGLTKPLQEMLKVFERLDQGRGMHPFEQRLSELTIAAYEKKGNPPLGEVLTEIRDTRKLLLEVTKATSAEIKGCASARDANEISKRGFEELAGTMDLSREGVEHLVQLTKALRAIPVVKLLVPSVVLVGAPNVGKSSIVRAISSGTPEVNNYPFTTRGVTIGHVRQKSVFEKFGSDCQVMDTPGMLLRDEEDRNEMEELTLASMLYLPTAVIYVMDPSGLCGTPFDQQRKIRDGLRERFPQRPWVDVVSKADAERGLDHDAALEPEGALHVSADVGTNMDDLKDRVQHMLQSVSDVLEQRVQAAKAQAGDA